MLKAIEVDKEQISLNQIKRLEIDFDGVTIEIFRGRDVMTKIRQLNEVRFIDSDEERG